MKIKMKILLFIDSLGSGGAQRQMVTLAKIFQNLKYEVSFLVYHKEDFFKAQLDELNIHVNYILEPNPILRIWKIRRFIRAGDYSTVISFLDTPNFINCISAIGDRNWKVVTSERSAKRSFFSSKKGKLFGWFQRYSDTIVCNSNNAKAMWEQHYPNYINKLSVIYNPVILPEITSEYIPKQNGKLHIVVAASYQYLKNPIGLIKALALLNEEEREKIEVNWYGSLSFGNAKTNAYQHALKLIKEFDLLRVISLNPATIDIANKMNEADVVALFSKLEGLPNAICEGMMIGKPIMMTKVSDYAVLVDDSNGVLCDWKNPDNIKEALVKTINLSIEDLKLLGQASKEKAAELFLKENIANQWINKF